MHTLDLHAASFPGLLLAPKIVRVLRQGSVSEQITHATYIRSFLAEQSELAYGGF